MVKKKTKKQKDMDASPLGDWLDDKLLIVGLGESAESSLRKRLAEDLTKSFVEDETDGRARNKRQSTKEGAA